MSKQKAKEPEVKALDPASIPDEEMERVRQQRYQARVERVLLAMQREGVDWRAVAFVTPDGRIGTRVVPVDMRRKDAGATTD